MKALVFSPAASADIEAIWDYTAANWSPDQADLYIDGVRDTCDALACGRKRGQAVEIRPGYLKYRCGSHVIFYRDRGARLEIIRILHGRQDVERHL
jgi:toxin ParE1/3/4